MNVRQWPGRPGFNTGQVLPKIKKIVPESACLTYSIIR